MKIHIRMENFKETQTDLGKLAKQIPKIGQKQVYDSLKVLLDTKLTKYPPKRPGQKYIRTMMFKYSWRLQELSRNRVLLENDVSSLEDRSIKYAMLVVGDAFGKYQAWMHRGRWYVFRDEVVKVLIALVGKTKAFKGVG